MNYLREIPIDHNQKMGLPDYEQIINLDNMNQTMSRGSFFPIRQTIDKEGLPPAYDTAADLGKEPAGICPSFFFKCQSFFKFLFNIFYYLLFIVSLFIFILYYAY